MKGAVEYDYRNYFLVEKKVISYRIFFRRKKLL